MQALDIEATLGVLSDGKVVLCIKRLRRKQVLQWGAGEGGQSHTALAAGMGLTQLPL